MLSVTSPRSLTRFFLQAAALITVLLFQSFQAAAQLKNGLDVLLDGDLKEFKGKRIGLITNKTGLDRFAAANYQLFAKKGIKLKAIFAPEHGFLIDTEAGKFVENANLPDGVRVFSLYGATKKPTKEMLDNVDALVFDIQDIGVRCYTYISTMNLAMEACAEERKEFIVLDRPNPIAPIAPDGWMRDSAYVSFVGMVQVPFIHGMTVGELATMIQAEEFPELKLSVVRMEGYSPNKFDDEQFRWVQNFVQPSPNIPDVETEILYTATVFLEATNVSEGRGTVFPFKQFGAPFIVAEDLAFQLRILHLDGVYFEPVSFTPQAVRGKAEKPKFQGQKCYGVKMSVTDRQKIKPFEIAVGILTVLEKLYPKEVNLAQYGSFLDKLAGTDKMRKMVAEKTSFEKILAESRKDIPGFLERKKKYSLY
ncbi:MAG: DUF1343 domain-containing protein [Chlorobiales bacterium]|nr:DUF1343 domain-containing protein [Chlorobiales bacterium]